MLPGIIIAAHYSRHKRGEIPGVDPARGSTSGWFTEPLTSNCEVTVSEAQASPVHSLHALGFGCPGV